MHVPKVGRRRGRFVGRDTHAARSVAWQGKHIGRALDAAAEAAGMRGDDGGVGDVDAEAPGMDVDDADDVDVAGLGDDADVAGLCVDVDVAGDAGALANVLEVRFKYQDQTFVVGTFVRSPLVAAAREQGCDMRKYDAYRKKRLMWAANRMIKEKNVMDLLDSYDGMKSAKAEWCIGNVDFGVYRADGAEVAHSKGVSDKVQRQLKARRKKKREEPVRRSVRGKTEAR